LGSLAGAALLGTYQIVREKFHSSIIVEQLTLLDPRVVARVQSSAAGYASTVTDPSLRTNLGYRALSTVATREANVLAYNDVFMFICVVAILTMLWIFIRSLWLLTTTQAAPPAPPPVPASGAPHP
jgi:hypothetical protein